MPYDIGSIVGRIRMDTTQWDQTRLRIVSNVRGLAASFTVAGAAMATPLIAAAKEFGKFELAMRKATSVSKVTEDQFRAMSKQAETASVRWGEAADVQSKAFLFLGRAGLTATQQMQAFDPVIMASKAMMEDLEATAEGVVNVMNSFGIGFEKTAYIADVMTQAVNASTMNLQDLMVALSYAGKPAKAFNNTIEDTAAMIGLVANEGIRGSKAGTALRFALTALASPTAEARNLLHELGVNAYNMATGQMLPFLDIMAQLETRLSGASEQLRNYMLETLFGRRAMPAMIALFDKGSQGVKAFSKSLQEANGVTKETAEKQMKALWSRVQQVWQSFLVLTRHMINAVIPSVTTFSERVRDVITELVKWVDQNQEIVRSWIVQIASIAELALKWGILLAIGSIVASVFKDVYSVFISLSKAVIALTIGLARGAVALSPYILMLGVLYIIRARWNAYHGDMAATLDRFADFVKEKTEAIKGFFESMIPDTIKDKFNDFLKFVGSFNLNMEKLRQRLPFPMKQLAGPGTAVMGYMGQTAKESAQFWGKFGKSSWEAIKQETSNAADDVVSQFNKDYDTVKEKLMPKVKELLGIGKEFGIGILKDVDDEADKILKLILSKLMPPGIKEAMDRAAPPFNPPPLSANMEVPIGGTPTKTLSNLQFITGKYKELWIGAIKSVRETMMSTQDVMEGSLKDVLSGWTDAFDKLMQKGSSFIDFMDNMFQTILRAFLHMVAQFAAQSLFTKMFGQQGITYNVGGGGIDPFTQIWNTFFPKNPDFMSSPYVGADYGGVMSAAGSQKVILNVANNGAPVALKQIGQERVGKDLVVSYVMEEMNNNPQFRDTVRGSR